MDQYETEEQQIAAIKEWFKENAKGLFVVAIVSVGAVLGWRYHLENQYLSQLQASAVYGQISVALQVNKTLDEAQLSLAEDLLKNNEDSSYAALTAMQLAKYKYDEKDVESSRVYLTWVIDHSSQEEMVSMAQLRLARILLAENELDQALALAEKAKIEGFISIADELRGDIYVAQGNQQAAKTAYDSAIDAQEGNASRFLRLKRNNLGQDIQVES